MDNAKVLAKVGNTVITEADVNDTILALGPRGQGYNNPEGRRAVLEQIVAKNLFLAEAKKNFYEGDPRFKADLAKVKDEMLANFAIEKTLSTVKVEDADLKKYYDEHKAEFVSEESVTASHILVDSEEKAKEILADIKAGKISFADAAKKESSCPSKERGGDLGRFGKGQMVPEFDVAVFAMEEGEISEPVKTQFGYHLINLTAKHPAEELAFSEVRDQINRKVLTDKQQAAYASKLNQLKILFPVDMY